MRNDAAVGSITLQCIQRWPCVLPPACANPPQQSVPTPAWRETLHDGVIVTVPVPTHARRHPMRGQQPLIAYGRVLYAAIRVMHHTRRRTASPHRHVQRGVDERLIERRSHGPSPSRSRCKIKQYGYGEPAFTGGDRRNGSGPLLPPTPRGAYKGVRQSGGAPMCEHRIEC